METISQAPEGTFRLDAAVPIGQEAQAEFYGVTSRTLRRWSDAGRGVADPPPLTNPAGMSAWWLRLKDKGIWKQRVPVEIETAAAKWAEMLAAPGPAAADPATVAAVADQPIDLSEFEKDDMGFDVGAKMAKINYQVHAKLLRDALASGKPDLFRPAHSAFEKAFEMYVTSEGRKSKIMAEQGLTVPRDEVRRQLVELHTPIPKRLKNSFREAWKALPDPKPEQSVWNLLVEKLVNAVCQRLTESFSM